MAAAQSKKSILKQINLPTDQIGKLYMNICMIKFKIKK